ncbi:hypothetical protein CONPUDRAFT_63241 [Coniophora puteana RWD-64-598 SS2]|uniref:DDE-1 domain-containing protein n=1 Tax=Coniophora puteana (strain RWD-64-598) TaxID=741705 RepID=A0A5M3MDC5_CONPW|nr:uncharacterized protein CONPUDRAFT_63241 [Coniophora puteana RWD-64-598 SS2]EIW76870.1 hypothetical protein CONPUDRAFT_63241 [Coniophora puteana RWD-64-598 SS2]
MDSDTFEDSLDDEDEDGIALESVPSSGYPGPSACPPPLPTAPAIEPDAQSPPRKRSRLAVPVREARIKAQEKRFQERQEALDLITASIKSRKIHFEGGSTGLQARRAGAIESCLFMIVKNGRTLTDASERAAESQHFSAKWGGRMVRGWVAAWVKSRELPKSAWGQHTKSASLLEDPSICAELSAYVRTNKWSMNPGKLQKLLNQELPPNEAHAYASKLVTNEIPLAVKNYLEERVLPRLHRKARQDGLSISTARRFLHKFGFQYTNDSHTKNWGLEGEQPLKKKGPGRGTHQSDFICSTVGWMAEASQSLEYGKNYEGYWNAELLVKQVKEKFIPAFEKLHGPGYKALVMFDHSQGHLSYAIDALVANRMNLRPGGKQAVMRPGWFLKDGEKIPQCMNFPPDHSQFPTQPKGMQAKYLRDHTDYTFNSLKKNMPKALASVKIETIRRWEHRMWRWIEAYSDGLSVKAAQSKVKEFSSKRYTSHRRIPDTLASALDETGA